MTLRFEYSLDSGETIGHRTAEPESPVIDDLLRNTSFHLSIEFNPPLAFIDGAHLLNCDEEQQYRCSFYPKKSPELEPTYLQWEIWRDLTWKRRNEIASALNAEFLQIPCKDLKPGQLSIDWYGEPVEIELTLCVDLDVSCQMFEQQCRDLDHLLGSIWDDVATFSRGVSSAQPRSPNKADQ